MHVEICKVCYLFRSRGDEEVAILVVLDVVVVGDHAHDLVKLNLPKCCVSRNVTFITEYLVNV